jgi:hypothetical protein
VKNYKVTWNWYVVRKNSKTVHILGVADRDSITKNYLSTKNRFKESWSYVLPGQWQSDEDSQWELEVNLSPTTL